jgi:membrane fusion protein, protease secretion system
MAHLKGVKMLAKIISSLERRFSSLISAFNPYDPSKLDERGGEPISLDEGAVRSRAIRVFFFVFLAFLIWSVVMPIASGVPVTGKVVVSGYRKSVQHQAGGVVQAILVQEGQKVRAGQVLFKVNPLSTVANLATYEFQYLDLLVSESRLKAEVLGQPAIKWVPELSEFKNKQQVEEAKAVQQELFLSRKVELQSSIGALEAQIDGLSSSISSSRIELETLNEEYRSTQDLAREGFIPRNQANATLRAREQQIAGLSNAKSQIAKLRAEISKTRMSFLADVQKNLSEVQKNKEAFSTKVASARFEQAQTEIRAPVAGTVVGLNVFTVGGVIRGGETLAQILPSDGNFVVEIKIPPNLIDKVRAGMPADVRFLAFNQTTTPVIDGIVSLVGVDLLTRQEAKDETAPPEFYLAQVKVTQDGAKKLEQLRVQPGMPVDVIVKTGERTFMSYFLKPLTDKLARSFKD